MAEQKNVRVCVDAMGGDDAVSEVLAGVEQALQADSKIEILLSGLEEIVVPFAASHERVEALVASEVIEMADHPAKAIKDKKDSSIVRAAHALKEGSADAFFSAGSTGAILAALTLITGRIKGIKRPAVCFQLPTKRPLTVLDLGANADVKPEYLLQFALMGEAFAQSVFGVSEPEIGLLNIGSEETKGSIQVQESYQLLKREVKNFKGNAEGTDLFSNRFDVIVTDGQSGNIALKTLEGTAKFLVSNLKEALKSSFKSKIGALLTKDALRSLKDVLNADAYGGGFLLGVDSVCIIGHGHTSSRAVKNGILACAKAVRNDLTGTIASKLKQKA